MPEPRLTDSRFKTQISKRKIDILGSLGRNNSHHHGDSGQLDALKTFNNQEMMVMPN